MKVLVTGGLGYLGSVLTSNLVDKGFGVSIVDSGMYGNHLKKSVLDKTTLLMQRINKPNGEMSRLVAESDAVVHLAGVVGDQACDLFKEEAMSTNLTATKDLIKMCEKFNKKMLFASTCSVYGASNELLDETSDILPLSTYAFSKYVAENMLSNSGVQFTAFRFGTLFGFSDRMRFDLVVNTFVGRAMAGKKITVFGGDQYRPFLHIRDASRFITEALETDIFDRGVYNLGGVNVKIGDLGDEIKRHFKDADVEATRETKDARNYRVDSSRVLKTFKSRFAYGIPDGIREMKKGIEDAGIKDFDSTIYSNVEHMRSVLGKTKANN
ncbi:MAG: SDR family oxidoreductase [Candidatus Micrarchaeota archaeon]|nr:SDR family oxidoreductase [Candidatus Micrarchaeota archaeon]